MTSVLTIKTLRDSLEENITLHVSVKNGTYTCRAVKSRTSTVVAAVSSKTLFRAVIEAVNSVLINTVSVSA